MGSEKQAVYDQYLYIYISVGYWLSIQHIQKHVQLGSNKVQYCECYRHVLAYTVEGWSKDNNDNTS